MNRLEVGQTAPKFSIETPQGPVTLDQLLSQSTKGVIIYFYPKAGTPGCTKEACDFRDNLAALTSDGYTVIGISPDSIAQLEKFAENQELPFHLGSDPDHAIMEEYGAWGEKTNYGRTFLGVIRSTFVVDPQGVLTLAQYNVKATGHVARLMKALA